MNMERIIHCAECIHCLTDRRSRTGYSCEMWGYLDFASPTELTGWCYKAKPKNEPEKSYLRSGPMTEADIDVALHKFVRRKYIECDFAHPKYGELREKLVTMHIYYEDYLRVVLRAFADEYDCIKILER